MPWIELKGREWYTTKACTTKISYRQPTLWLSGSSKFTWYIDQENPIKYAPDKAAVGTIFYLIRYDEVWAVIRTRQRVDAIMLRAIVMVLSNFSMLYTFFPVLEIRFMPGIKSLAKIKYFTEYWRLWRWSWAAKSQASHLPIWNISIFTPRGCSLSLFQGEAIGFSPSIELNRGEFLKNF